MSKTLLIDANSIFYAAQHATKLTSGGMETQAVFGAIKTARELCKTYPGFRQIWCHDTKAEWRFKLLPTYKSTRSDTAEKVAVKKALNEQRSYMGRAFSALGLCQMTVNGYEADDIIGFMAKKLSAVPENKIGIISGDRDLCQLVRANVFWRDMRDDSRIVTASNFYDFTGCKSPMEFLERKCLAGDGSDTITGVGGIGDKGAPEFIAEFGSVREFWRRCDAGEFVPKLKAHQRLWKGECEHDMDAWTALFPVYDGTSDLKAYDKRRKAHADNWPGQGRLLFRRNFQLMQLLKVTPPKKEDLRVDTGRLDKDAFAGVCEELGFISILKNLDEFVNHFINKQGN